MALAAPRIITWKHDSDVMRRDKDAVDEKQIRSAIVRDSTRRTNVFRHKPIGHGRNRPESNAVVPEIRICIDTDKWAKANSNRHDRFHRINRLLLATTHRERLTSNANTCLSTRGNQYGLSDCTNSADSVGLQNAGRLLPTGSPTNIHPRRARYERSRVFDKGAVRRFSMTKIWRLRGGQLLGSHRAVHRCGRLTVVLSVSKTPFVKANGLPPKISADFELICRSKRCCRMLRSHLG